MPRGRERPGCVVEDCDRPHYAKGACHLHRRRFVRTGSYERKIAAPHDKTQNADGYVLIWMPDHPAAYSNGRIPEHRYVMEQMLGRLLLPMENVHHKNGRRDDNRPENLELWTTQQPKGQRVDDLVEFANDILRLYGRG